MFPNFLKISESRGFCWKLYQWWPRLVCKCALCQLFYVLLVRMGRAAAMLAAGWVCFSTSWKIKYLWFWEMPHLWQKLLFFCCSGESVLKLPKCQPVPPTSQARQLPFPCQPTPALHRGGKPSSQCQGGCFDAVSEFFFSHHDSLCFADTCPMTGTFLSRTTSTQLQLMQ